MEAVPFKTPYAMTECGYRMAYDESLFRNDLNQWRGSRLPNIYDKIRPF